MEGAFWAEVDTIEDYQMCIRDRLVYIRCDKCTRRFKKPLNILRSRRVLTNGNIQQKSVLNSTFFFQAG